LDLAKEAAFCALAIDPRNAIITGKHNHASDKRDGRGKLECPET
jgi:hypothetical protein